MGRPVSNRKQKAPLITLIGEGMTEQYYFKHIRSIYGYKYILKPYYFGTTSLKDMDRKIAEVVAGGGIAICVFDTDVSERVEAEKKKLTALFKKYNKKENVIFCDSLPAIEYWFLLHYQNTNKYYNNANSVEDELSLFLLDYRKSTVYLEKEKWVSDLCANEQLEIAIERARKFGKTGESYSNIFKAFDIFRK
ncbi:MAG: RloB family protein [Paludibacter sp.]|nr:RloB family protein [Paludibacter sp.]